MNSNSLSEPKKVKGAKVKNEALRQKIISDNKNKCMPYTLEEIQTCKNITLEKRLKDFKNLCDFKADTNPKNFFYCTTFFPFTFQKILKKE